MRTCWLEKKYKSEGLEFFCIRVDSLRKELANNADIKKFARDKGFNDSHGQRGRGRGKREPDVVVLFEQFSEEWVGTSRRIHHRIKATLNRNSSPRKTKRH